MSINSPNIPSLSTKVDAEVRRAFDAIKALFNSAAAAGGVVTQVDLEASINAIPVNPYVPAYDGSFPPIINNLVVTGAFRTIILSWDDPAYAKMAYVEVWRHTSDDLGAAVMVGSTSSLVYTDIPPNASLAAVYYYWVRGVSISGIAGAFTPTSATSHGSTANDPDYIMELLSSDATVPLITLAVDTLINGVTVPAGTYIRDAFIHAATIVTAMIKDAAIDSAKIADLAVTSAKIQDAAITNVKIGDYIRSSAYDPGVTGWNIHKNGSVEFNDVRARGDIEASSIGAACPVPMARITDLMVDTLQIAGNAVIIPASASANWSFGTWVPTGWSNLIGVTITLPHAGAIFVTATLDCEGTGYITSPLSTPNVTTAMMAIFRNGSALTGGVVCGRRVMTFYNSPNSGYSSLGACASVGIKENLPAGTYTYYLTSWGGGNTTYGAKLGNASIVALGVMR